MSFPARPPSSASRSSSSPRRSSTRRRRGPTATRSSSTSTSRRGRWGTASARTQRPSVAELRAVSQPARIFERNSGEHWAGKLYVRRYSIYLTRLVLPTRVTPNALTWGMIVAGVLAAGALTVPGLWGAIAAFLLIQCQILLDCSDGELARWRKQSSVAGIYLDRFAHYFTESLLPIALGIRADGGWGSIGGFTTPRGGGGGGGRGGGGGGGRGGAWPAGGRPPAPGGTPGAGAAGAGGDGAGDRRARGGRAPGRGGHRGGGGAARLGARTGAADGGVLPVLPRLRGDRGDDPGAGRCDRRLVRRRRPVHPRPRDRLGPGRGDHPGGTSG